MAFWVTWLKYVNLVKICTDISLETHEIYVKRYINAEVRNKNLSDSVNLLMRRTQKTKEI